MADARTGADGLPICDEFACRTWGCWCDRSPDPECEHGNHPRDCPECPPIHSYEEFRRRYFPTAIERERRKRLTLEERAREDGAAIARDALSDLRRLLRQGGGDG